MKKYWIKDLNENQVIHAPKKEIARKLHKKFDMLGLKWCTRGPYSGRSRWDKYKEGTCYRPYKGEFCSLNYYAEHGYEILNIDQLLDFQANEYPKVMEVSNNNTSWRKRVVFMEKNGKFLAWNAAESIEEAEDKVCTTPWLYAREIQPAPTLELTLDQIAEKFNVNPEQIKIKK